MKIQVAYSRNPSDEVLLHRFQRPNHSQCEMLRQDSAQNAVFWRRNGPQCHFIAKGGYLFSWLYARDTRYTRTETIMPILDMRYSP